MQTQPRLGVVKLSLNWLLAGAVESLQSWEEGQPVPRAAGW